jgi:hypothetical protein
MKHLIIFLLLSLSSGLFAQQILSVNDDGKAPYTYAGETLNMRSLGVVLESNPEAYALYKGAKGTSSTANVLAYTGGFLIGNQLARALRKGEGTQFNGMILIAGATLAGTGLAIVGGAKKRLVQGVELYNRDFPPAPASPEVSLNLGATANGMGLVLSF